MPRKVIVVGASGFIGKATLSALVSRHGGNSSSSDGLEIYAGVRDTSKFGDMAGVTVINADMGDKTMLAKTLKGFDAVYLVVPGHAERTQLAIDGIEAAKEAGIKFLLVLSVTTAGTDSVFGKQFEPIEAKTKESGIDYAIVQLPIFLDNNFAHIASVKEQSTFYDPRNPSKASSAVSVADAGKAAADILAKPARHVGKTYKLVSPAFSVNDLAAAFTKVLGKEVKPTTVTYKDCKDALVGVGIPAWQADGILELYRYIDEDSPVTNVKDADDIERITGEKAITVEGWVRQNASMFQ